MSSRWKEMSDVSIASVLSDHHGFVMCALWRVIISSSKDTFWEAPALSLTNLRSVLFRNKCYQSVMIYLYRRVYRTEKDSSNCYA